MNNGIHLSQNQATLNVWPVPFEYNFIMKAEVKNARFSISNSFGQIMMNGKISDMPVKIDAGLWPPGNYFLRRETDDGVIVRKIITL